MASFKMFIFCFFALVGTARASCPNACSDNGTCNSYSACECYRNWMSADCSQRQCPWGFAFIDIPAGDLNADGRVDKPNLYSVALCAAESFFTDPPTDATELAKDVKGLLGVGSPAVDKTTLKIFGKSGNAWDTTAKAIKSKVLLADQFSTANDPEGVVAKCLERDSTMTHAIRVHVESDTAPSPVCQPGAWDDTTKTACSDTTDTDGTPDLKRAFTLDGYNTDGDDKDTSGIVGDIFQLTYPTQQTNAPLGELYSNDHGIARSKQGGTTSSAATVAVVKNKWDEAHFYSECSSKGLCDRSTGLCACFPGYTGDGCDRVACPNECSGHGTCERMKDASSLYMAWDAYKTQKCNCDNGYAGPNCALRKCPSGDDPISRTTKTDHNPNFHHGTFDTAKEHNFAHRDQAAEVQFIGVNDYDKLLTGSGTAGSKSAPFALEFTDQYGDKWATRAIEFREAQAGTCSTAGRTSRDTCGTCSDSAKSGRAACITNGAGSADSVFTANTWTPATWTETAPTVASKIEAALEALPNGVINNVEVNPAARGVVEVNGDLTEIRCAITGPETARLSACVVKKGGFGPVYLSTVTAHPATLSPDNIGVTIVLNSSGAASTGLQCTPSGGSAVDVAGTTFLADWITPGGLTFDPSSGSITAAELCKGGVLSQSGVTTPVTVTLRLVSKDEVGYSITFVDNPGDIPPLGARFNWQFNSGNALNTGTSSIYCGDSIKTGTNEDGAASANNCAWNQNTATGAFPVVTAENPFVFYNAELRKGDQERGVCSNRGLCDYTTGMCKCFAGYTQNDCSVQNALGSA